jgi:glucose-1-phosphate thymidylyltransferase
MILIIPCAGKGTRLRPHTLITPKPLIKLAGKPMIFYSIDPLILLPIEKILLVISKDGEEIYKIVKENYNIEVDYVIQEEQLGLGHAIYVALEKLNKNKEILILLGDTIVETEFKNFDENFIGLYPVSDPSRFGVALCDGERIVKLVEKPKEFISNLIIAGIYFFKNSRELKEAIKEIIEKDIRTKGEYQLTDAIELLLEKGIYIRKEEIKKWLDCGTVESLLLTQREILRERNKNYGKIENSIITHPCYVEEDVLIKNSIVGPFVSIGKNSKVEHSIIKDSIIGEGAYIENLIIKNSIIGNNAKIFGNEKELNISDFSEVKI